MKYILDTNIVAELLKDAPAICSKLTLLRRDQVLIPQPVLAEIEFGLARLGRSKRHDRLRQRLTVLLAEIRRSAWSDAVSCSFGEIKAHLQRTKQLVEDFDIAIAAHAHAVRGTLVTRNLRHFERMDALLVEAW